MEQERIINTNLELPTTSKDMVCQFYLREIARGGRMQDVQDYIGEKMSNLPDIYSSADEFLAANPEYEKGVLDSLDHTEKAAVKQYSGYRFAWINSVARGFWDYDKLGRKTPELEAEIKETTQDIIGAFAKVPAPKNDFVTFRGTNLDEFRSYGINSVADLASMKGQFMLSQGFTSTAIAREKSFADRDVSDLWIGKSNVEVRFHIPAGSHETIALVSDELSYSPEQTEVLINHDALSYISNVAFDKENHAIVDAILIPENIYDPYVS